MYLTAVFRVSLAQRESSSELYLSSWVLQHRPGQQPLRMPLRQRGAPRSMPWLSDPPPLGLFWDTELVEHWSRKRLSTRAEPPAPLVRPESRPQTKGGSLPASNPESKTPPVQGARAGQTNPRAGRGLISAHTNRKNVAV